ncbi:hypothetical protein ISF_04294 [Cordyceps fumosorosea ARSEF 2679]|uniref:DUF7707 domain-containing protein n=1 Tax=Cordyceps fumosorosea (strain ARSEF 2679) TaxID=1081104 RepID=A0A167XEM7_CORFA|nr:hypothetical protein ISF_04294 [Cordyceps fumosorosea ARSEF 2679]OAA64884.1 hypothetical protein ISF_04294 [Cordyceps fumosorosea ARSEF 2679]
MFAKSLILALAAAGAATAQVQNYTSSLDMTIDPNQVPAQDRGQWCNAETNTCSQLCNNDASTNDCSATTLQYKCLCSSNSSTPGLEYYSQTMPTFICLKLFDQCTSQNVGNANNQKLCKSNIMSHCGTLDPTKVSTGGSSSASGSATSASPQATSQTGGSGSASSTSSSHGLAAPTMAAGQGIAAAAAAVGVFAYLI